MADKQPQHASSGSAMEALAHTFQEMKFRKKLLGGVDEADVWKKLEKLQQEYETLYQRQEAYYQALMEDRDRTLARLMQERDGVARG